MHDHVVDDLGRVLHEPPVQADGPCGVGAAPARARAGQAQAGPLHAQQRRMALQAGREPGAGLAQHPGLHAGTHLGSRCVWRQGQVQGLAAVGRLFAVDLAGAQRLGFATGEKQCQGTPQIVDLAAVLPPDACRLLGPLALPGLLELAQYPARLRIQCLPDGRHAHPCGRADHQPLRADGEAYGAPARPLQPIVQHLPLENRLLVGLRMNEGTVRGAGGRGGCRCRCRCRQSLRRFGLSGSLTARPQPAVLSFHGGRHQPVPGTLCRVRHADSCLRRGRPRGRGAASRIRSSFRLPPSAPRACGPRKGWACLWRHRPRPGS